MRLSIGSRKQSAAGNDNLLLMIVWSNDRYGNDRQTLITTTLRTKYTTDTKQYNV